MSTRRIIEALLLAAGMVAGAWVLGQSLLQFKQADRSVEVKGLAEREVPADTAIWPVAFSEADNDLPRLYQTLQERNAKIAAFLQASGFKPEEILPFATLGQHLRAHGNNGCYGYLAPVSQAKLEGIQGPVLTQSGDLQRIFCPALDLLRL